MKNWVLIGNNNFEVIDRFWFLVLRKTDGDACGVNTSWYKLSCR